MRKSILIGMVAVAGLVGGCSSGKAPATAKAGVTDIAPPPPVRDDVYAAPMVVTPVSNSSGGRTAPIGLSEKTIVDPSPAHGTKYVVKKGDTLWGVAQRTYGDGKQYKKITAANPQIKNDVLLAGTTITLP